MQFQGGCVFCALVSVDGLMVERMERGIKKIVNPNKKKKNSWRPDFQLQRKKIRGSEGKMKRNGKQNQKSKKKKKKMKKKKPQRTGNFRTDWEVIVPRVTKAML